MPLLTFVADLPTVFGSTTEHVSLVDLGLMFYVHAKKNALSYHTQ